MFLGEGLFYSLFFFFCSLMLFVASLCFLEMGDLLDVF